MQLLWSFCSEDFMRLAAHVRAQIYTTGHAPLPIRSRERQTPVSVPVRYCTDTVIIYVKLFMFSGSKLDYMYFFSIVDFSGH